MTDILETLDELEEDIEDSENTDESEEESDAVEGELVDGQELEIRGEGEFSEEKARDITEAIKSVATATFGLLHQAYQHKAHKALGYSSWEKYVKEEFEMSKSRSYQLIAQAETIEAIKEITPEGTEVKLTEAQVRDIKKELTRITEVIKEETSEMTAEEAEDFVNELIAREREQAQADQKAIEAKKKAEQESQREGYENALEDVADGMLAEDPNGGKAYSENGVVMEPDENNMFSADADSGFNEYEVSGNAGAMSSEDALNLYNFFNSLSGITSLPEPEYLLEIIPEDRMNELENQLPEAASWFNRMFSLYDEKY